MVTQKTQNRTTNGFLRHNSSPFVLPVEKMKSASNHREIKEKLMADTFNERRRWITSGKGIAVEKIIEEFPLLLRNTIEVSEDL